MEHNIRFGLIFGQLAILKKKNCADYEQATFEAGFFMFSWAKTKSIFLEHCSVHT